MMTIEQCRYDLQWQPMSLGETKAERYERQRKIREERQMKREEFVLFMQSLLFYGLGSAIGVGLLILGGLGGKF